jgi:hypothetical protein
MPESLASRRPRIPPLDVIRQVQAALTDAGARNVVGGSALLAGLGLVSVVNDWDLVTDAEPAKVADTLTRLGVQFGEVPATAPFRSERLLVIPENGYSIDVIVRFAIAGPTGVVRIPARPGGRWNGLQLADPRDWERAYRLMGRVDRADLLLRTLPVSTPESAEPE